MLQIPKEFIDGFEEGTELDLTKNGDQLVLTPRINTRKDWVEQIKNVGADLEEDDFILNDFDENDWEWK